MNAKERRIGARAAVCVQKRKRRQPTNTLVSYKNPFPFFENDGDNRNNDESSEKKETEETKSRC